MQKVKGIDFARFVKQRAAVKDGYIFGAIGQKPADLSSWYFEQQYSGSEREKAKYWRKNAERVWDCQGLIEGYLNEVLGTKINVRARDNYATWCSPKGTGRIPVEHRKPGAAVFIYSSSAGYITHVGYLIEPVISGKLDGDWYVGEARGVMYGIVITKLYSRNWNRWGLMTKYVDYDVVLDKTDDLNLGDRFLKKGMEGADVKQLQGSLIDMGYSCGKYGIDGDFGTSTYSAVIVFQHDQKLIEDGIVGPKTVKAIFESLTDNADDPMSEPIPAKIIKIKGGQWYVRTQPNTSGAKLGIARNGETYSFLGETSFTGWNLIDFNGEQGWITGKGCA